MNKTLVESSTPQDEQTEKALDMLIDHLDQHINRCIFILSTKGEKTPEFDRYNCASLMLLSGGISLVGIKKLSKPITLQSKDVVVLFRVVFEGIVNALYVLSSEPALAKKALRHATQKPFRNHGKEFNYGRYKFKLSLLLKGNLPEDLQRMIKEFTSPRGGERNWTSHTLRERINVISDKYGDHVLLSLGSVYEGFYGHSSEYIHSSLFGVFDFLKKRNKGEFISEMQKTIFTCVIEIGMAVVALLDVFEQETGIDEFNKASKSTRKILLKACEAVGGE